MKKILLIFPIVAGFITVNAQEESTSDRRNDIMLSPIELIAAPALNFSYERLLNKDSGVGINGIFDFQKDSESSGAQISPYYRMYFGKKYASGFFVEGFVPITMTTDTRYDYVYGPNFITSNSYQEKNTTIGLGVGFGGKWVARKNIIFEASIGIARRFGVDSTYDAAITGKGMLGIGYRF